MESGENCPIKGWISRTKKDRFSPGISPIFLFYHLLISFPLYKYDHMRSLYKAMNLQQYAYFFNKILMENNSTVNASPQKWTAGFTGEHLCGMYHWIQICKNLPFLWGFFGLFLVLQNIVNVMEEGKVWNDQMFIKSLTFYNCNNSCLKQWVSYVTWAFGGLTGNLGINTEASKALFHCWSGECASLSSQLLQLLVRSEIVVLFSHLLEICFFAKVMMVVCFIILNHFKINTVKAQ